MIKKINNLMVKEDCIIVENRQLADTIWTMTMKAPLITQNYIGAGQFILLLIDRLSEHPLRRPMSIANVEGDHLSIIYKTIGSVTNEMIHLKPDDTIDVLGPLGNIFTGFENNMNPILIGGGVGLAPILNLQKELKESTVIIGARTENEHFLTHSIETGLMLTTDDGTLGIKGTVLTVLSDVITKLPKPAIYACGPTPMLKALQTFTIENDIPAQFSVESYMACGIGICQGCVIKNSSKISNSDPTYHKKFDLVCTHGPVFPAEEISFD